MPDRIAKSLENVSLTRRRGRYDADAVDRLFEQFKSEYQQLWKERDRLRRHLDAAEKELNRYREIERNLGNALLVGEAAASELREKATLQADVLVTEARAEADSITADARAEADRILKETREASAGLEQQITDAETRLREGRQAYRSFLVEALRALEARSDEVAEADREAVREATRDKAPLPQADKAFTSG